MSAIDTICYLTRASEGLFKQLAGDSFDWDGAPRYESGSAQIENLKDLISKGLITTFEEDGAPHSRAGTFVQFTNEGLQYAASHDIEILGAAYCADYYDY